MLPILVLAFNRSQALKMLLDSILIQEHGEIYISCDGPRPESPLETKQTQQLINDYKSKNLIQYTRFSTSNEGTLGGIKKGIDWFFNQVSEGLIIEDDLILHPPLLAKAELIFNVFREDKTVGSIGLRNIVPKEFLSEPEATFRYSRLFVSHGWGTSAVNWRKFNSELTKSQIYRNFFEQSKIFGVSKAMHILLNLNEDRKLESKNQRKCNWDNRWQLAHNENQWTSIILNHNHVEYNGYGESATHTQKPNPRVNNLFENPSELFEFNAPVTKFIDAKADGWLLSEVGVIRALKARLRLRSRLGGGWKFIYRWYKRI